jgi:transposase-like protein
VGAKEAEETRPTPAENERFKVLERENRKLRRANEILRKAGAFFAAAGYPLRGLDRHIR